MPFPFANGEFVTATNLNTALRLGAQIQFRTFTPGSGTNFDGTGAFTTTFSFSNVTVPTGSTTAFAMIILSRVFLVAPINTTEYEMRIGVGGQFSTPTTRMCLDATDIISKAHPTVVVAGSITLSGSGSQTFLFQSQRMSGTGVGQIDTVSDAIGFVMFQ